MPTDQNVNGRSRGGLVIIAVLLLAAVVLLRLDVIRDLTRDHLDLVVVLSEAAGVRAGTPVRVAGVEAGRVQAVGLAPAAAVSDIAIQVRLEPDAAVLLRQDSHARAYRRRGIGEPLVVLEAGSRTAPPVTSGDTLRAHPRPDPAALLGRARELPDRLEEVLIHAERINALAAERRPELAVLGRRVDEAVREATALSVALDSGSLGPLLADDGVAVRIGRLQDRLGAVSEAVAAAAERYVGSDEAPAELTTSLAELADRTTRLRADLAELGGQAGGGGLLVRMQRDSAIDVAIRGIQAQMDSVRQEATSLLMRMFLP